MRKTALLALLAPLLLSACGSGDAPQSWHAYTAQGSYSATLSGDGHYAIIGSMQHGGSLWDVTKHERLFDWNHQQGAYTSIVASAFSPDGAYAATASSQDLVLWQVGNGQPIWFWSAPAEILGIALAPLGDYALLGLANHEAVYFDIKNGGIRQRLRHPARVRSVALDRSGTLALTGSDDYRVRLWDVASAQLRHEIEFGNTVDTVALSPDGARAFSSASLDRAVIWDTQSGQVLQTLSGDELLWTRRVSYLAARFSNDGKQLLTGSAAGSVQLWDVASGRQVRHWQAHKREAYGPVATGIYSVAFGPAGTYYAISSNGLLNVLK